MVRKKDNANNRQGLPDFWNLNAYQTRPQQIVELDQQHLEDFKYAFASEFVAAGCKGPVDLIVG